MSEVPYYIQRMIMLVKNGAKKPRDISDYRWHSIVKYIRREYLK